jgi:hypothetical protein
MRASPELPGLVPATELARFLTTGVISTGIDAGKRVFHVAATPTVPVVAPKMNPQLSTFAGYQTARPSSYNRSYSSGYVPTVASQRTYVYGSASQTVSLPFASQMYRPALQTYHPSTTTATAYGQYGQPSQTIPQPSLQSASTTVQPSPRLLPPPATNKK